MITIMMELHILKSSLEENILENAFLKSLVFYGGNGKKLHRKLKSPGHKILGHSVNMFSFVLTVS